MGKQHSSAWLQTPCRANPLHPTRLQAQGFVYKQGLCATAIQKGISSNTTGRREAFLPQQHLNRALFKFRAAESSQQQEGSCNHPMCSTLAFSSHC